MLRKLCFGDDKEIKCLTKVNSKKRYECQFYDILDNVEMCSFALMRSENDNGMCLTIINDEKTKRQNQAQLFMKYKNIDFVAIHVLKVPLCVVKKCGDDIMENCMDVYDVFTSLDCDVPEEYYFRLKLESCVLSALNAAANRNFVNAEGSELRPLPISLKYYEVDNCKCPCHLACECEC